MQEVLSKNSHLTITISMMIAVITAAIYFGSIMQKIENNISNNQKEIDLLIGVNQKQDERIRSVEGSYGRIEVDIKYIKEGIDDIKKKIDE